MAKGKPRHKDLPLDKKILKHYEMFIRKYDGAELTEAEKEEYLAKTRKNLERLRGN